MLYDYDMGDTTQLWIKVLGAYQGLAPAGKSITILARNQPPEIPCDVCERHPAVHICPECTWDGGGWLCQKCTTGHSCGDEAGYLPIPNSPRAAPESAATPGHEPNGIACFQPDGPPH